MAAKIFVALLLTGALAGCATTENYEKALSRWEGVHMDELVRSWGLPGTCGR
jgi:hypothetical protein